MRPRPLPYCAVQGCLLIAGHQGPHTGHLYNEHDALDFAIGMFGLHRAAVSTLTSYATARRAPRCVIGAIDPVDGLLEWYGRGETWEEAADDAVKAIEERERTGYWRWELPF